MFHPVLHSLHRHQPKSLGKNVLCCIEIPVMAGATFSAIPFTDRQRQLSYCVTTVRATLGAGEPLVNFDKLAPIPCGLVLQLSDQFTPTTIANGSRQFVVSYHSLHMQILNRNHLIFAYQLSGQLMQKVLSRILNSSLNPSHSQPCFISVVRPFLLLSQSLLSFLQSLVQSIEMSRVRDLLPSRERSHARNAQANPHLAITGFKGLYCWVIHQQGDKPSTRSVQPHCHSRRNAMFGDLATPSYGQGFFAFCEIEFTVNILKSRLCELCTSTVPLFLERWVFCNALPKVFVSPLQVPKTLLQRDTTDIIEKMQAIVFLPLRKDCRRLLIADFLLSFAKGFRSLMQHFVIHQSNAPQSLTQYLLLLWSRVKPIFESLLRISHFSVIYVRCIIAPYSRAPIPPALTLCV